MCQYFQRRGLLLFQLLSSLDLSARHRHEIVKGLHARGLLHFACAGACTALLRLVQLVVLFDPEQVLAKFLLDLFVEGAILRLDPLRVDLRLNLLIVQDYLVKLMQHAVELILRRRNQPPWLLALRRIQHVQFE
jgi:hypothetical protein